MNSINYRFVFSEKTMRHADNYALELTEGRVSPGSYFQVELDKRKLERPNALEIIEILVSTKKPQIFAERDVYGDGSDWNIAELKLLGSIGFYAPCEAFDNGHHYEPTIHRRPVSCGLLFVPGVLLRNERRCIPADWDVVDNVLLSKEKYFALYEQRIMPLLFHANKVAKEMEVKAVISMPGIGCGHFAGNFRLQLGVELEGVLIRLLSKYGSKLDSIAAIHYDPFNESRNSDTKIQGVKFSVRPLLSGNNNTSQLSSPDLLAGGIELDDELALFSFVAWDHVSWPGNDFYIGNRSTDDGVKAAATDVMTCITGFPGTYETSENEYLPNGGYFTWGEVVKKNSISLKVIDNSDVYDLKTGLAKQV